MVAAPETPEGFKTVYNYVPEAKFNRITGYGHDSTLPTNSQYLLLNEWDDISNIVHE